MSAVGPETKPADAFESPRGAREPLPRQKFFIASICVGGFCLVAFSAYWFWLKRPWWPALFYAFGSIYIGTFGLWGLRRNRRNQARAPQNSHANSPLE